MPFPILLPLSLLTVVTMIGIIQVIAAQIIPVGSPPRLHMIPARLVIGFLKEVLTEYGPRLLIVLHLLIRMRTILQIKALTSVLREKELKNSLIVSVHAGILLPVICTVVLALWAVLAAVVSIGLVRPMVTTPVAWVFTTVAASTPRTVAYVHSDIQSVV